MSVELSKFDPKNLEHSTRYLLATLSSEAINDVSDPSQEAYMKFANLLEGHLLFSGSNRDVTRLWKEILKAVARSERAFGYSLYKGHILTHLAVVSLVSERDLDKTVKLLQRSHEEDKLHGYTHPEHRAAYKILSFLQPMLMFRNELWPSSQELRGAIANRLRVVLPLNTSGTAIAWGPDAIRTDIASCIPENQKLLKILTDNASELEEISALATEKNTFYKSTTFLIANIVEGILLDLATRSLLSRADAKGQLPSAPGDEYRERDSIRELARKLRRNGVIDGKVEYFCRFVQHYRDFIHPARNLKHDYALNVNFNKLFLMFFILLLGDLSRASVRLG